LSSPATKTETFAYSIHDQAHHPALKAHFTNVLGDCITSWQAHLESIASLAISPDGSTLLSGAHDASVRFWDLADKTCLQEALPPHRQRADEGVLAVAWGDDEVAGSAGADGIVKLYVEQSM